MLEKLNSNLLEGLPEASTLIMGVALGASARDLENISYHYYTLLLQKWKSTTCKHSFASIQAQRPTILVGHAFLSPSQPQFESNVSRAFDSVILCYQQSRAEWQ